MEKYTATLCRLRNITHKSIYSELADVFCKYSDMENKIAIFSKTLQKMFPMQAKQVISNKTFAVK